MKKRAFAGCALMAGIVVIALVQMRSRQSDLVSRSKRVAVLNGFNSRYFWLNDREILYLGGTRWAVTASKLDLASGVLEPLPKLTKSLAEYGAEGERHLSPDKEQLLWTGYGTALNGPDRGKWVVGISGFDGQRTIDRIPAQAMDWLPDSSGWFVLGHEGNIARVRKHLLGSKSVVEISVPNVRESRAPGPAGMQMATLGGSQPLGFISPDKLLIANTHVTWGVSSNPATYFFLLDLSDGHASSRSYKVVHPNNVLVNEVSLSPDGTKLLWTTQTVKYESPFTFRLRRLIPFLPSYSSLTDEIRVSDLSGNNMRVVGGISKPNPANRRIQPEIEGAQWAPNGKRISYVYKGALYLLDR